MRIEDCPYNRQRIHIMIIINENLVIPAKELSYTFSCSSSPGGQNVNKVSTKVTLRFDVQNSPSLTERQRDAILNNLAQRIDKRGILHIVSDRFRTQGRNRKDSDEKFRILLEEALREIKRRKKTKTPRAALRKRLDIKKQRSRLKKKRANNFSWND